MHLNARDASTVITSVAAGAAILMGNDEEAPPPSRQGQGPRERRERTPSYLTKWYKMIMSDGFRDPTSAVGRGRALPSGDCLRPRGYIWTTGIRRWFGADGPCGRHSETGCPHPSTPRLGLDEFGLSTSANCFESPGGGI